MDSNGDGGWDWRNGAAQLLFLALIASPLWVVPLIYAAMGWRTAP